MAAVAEEIPAETATATQTDYEPALLIDEIHPHPKNIRHNATADDELIASIREQGLLQPLVVVGAADVDGESGGYLLIAGHRRLDGLKKAGYTSAPAIVRYDLQTEAEQIAAMLVENGRREDLTPIEEAEGFDLLAELGWDYDQMVAASGRSKATIKDRRRLTHLPAKAKSAVDTGQVTIDDGIRMSKLPAAEVKHLEANVGSKDFRLLVTKAETKVRIEANVKAESKRLRDAGIPELDRPKDAWYIHSLAHSRHGMVRLATTGKPNASDHDGCLAFVIGRRDDGLPTIWEVCTDPIKHDAELSAEQLARKEEREASQTAIDQANQAKRAEREAAEQAARAARQMRMDAIVSATRGKVAGSDGVLYQLIVAALPSLLYAGGFPEEEFHAAANVTTNDEVGSLGGITLVKAFAAFLAAWVEEQLDDAVAAPLRHQVGAVETWLDAYLMVLELAGHEQNSADEALISDIREKQANR